VHVSQFESSGDHHPRSPVTLSPHTRRMSRLSQNVRPAQSAIWCLEPCCRRSVWAIESQRLGIRSGAFLRRAFWSTETKSYGAETGSRRSASASFLNDRRYFEVNEKPSTILSWAIAKIRISGMAESKIPAAIPGQLVAYSAAKAAASPGGSVNIF